MRPLKFESCLSVPNELRLLPRLLPQLTPESSACLFLPSGPSEPRLSADLPDNATNHPKRAPVSPDSATEEPRIMPNQFYSGLGPENFKLFKVFGVSSRSAKNHQESSRLTTNLLRLTPIHPDSATTHPDSKFVAYSAPDSGMCNWGLTHRKSYLVIICPNSHNKLTKSEIRSSSSRFEYCSESLF